MNIDADCTNAPIAVQRPLDESQRLIVLARYSILNTPREPIFDSLTAVGAFCFKAPICLITLIGEDAHFFKSAYGVELSEAPRNDSFCDSTLLQDEPLVVLNAALDDRFSTNSLAFHHYHARFYAGCALTTADGYRLGTFSIIDTVPRESFDEQELATLKHLTALATQAIEQRLLAQQVATAERKVREAAEYTKQILDSTTDNVFLLDGNWNISYINEGANRQLANGRTLVGMNFWEAFPQLIGSQIEHNYRRAVREQIPIQFADYSLSLQAFLEISVHPCGDGLAVAYRDVTLAHVKEVERRKAEERYRLATFTVAEGIFDHNWETGEAYFSARWQEIVGLPAVDFTGDTSHWTRRVHPQDWANFQKRADHLETSHAEEFQDEYRLRHEDGTWRWIFSNGRKFLGQSGKVKRVIGAIQDITDKKTRDPLTKLHNRNSLLEKIGQQIEQRAEKAKAGVEDSSIFALLAINIEQFKRINDSYGQGFGDKALIEIAQRIERTPSPSTANVVARIGGAKFMVLLERIEGVEEAVPYANLIRTALSAPIGTESQQISLVASFGVAGSNPANTSPQTMLEDAIMALHEAQIEGREECAIYGEHMRERARQQVQLESDLKGALHSEELLLHYQPKVVLATGEIIGFEALVRWIHPVQGFVPPSDFIPYAEESGLILEIGDWTLREAVRQLVRWRDAGLVGDSVTVAVNLSTRQFEKEDLVDTIRRCLMEERMPPHCLTLELTESALVGNIGHAKEVLKALSELGINIDMDDFGTGYSSLSYLHTLPFHALKIDQSFTRNLEESQESQAIARSILHLGQSLNLDVIAEGVETVEQRDSLLRSGCVYGQGHFYSQPLPADAVEKMLHSARKLSEEGMGLPLPISIESPNLRP